MATALPAAAAADTPCEDLAGTTIDAADIGLPTSGAQVTSARESTQGATAPYCLVEGRIAPVDPEAPDIRFRVNLPTAWNGKAVHFGGGGYNGTVVAGTGSVPSAPVGTATPLQQGYATFGSDSGHSSTVHPGGSFALIEESLVNFAYAALKKTRDVAVSLIEAHYERAPEQTYFVGSSQGGREGLTVAQRFPTDYDGVFSRVPVVNFTGQQLFVNALAEPILTGGWIDPAGVDLLHATTLATCDGLDGLEDGIISRPQNCHVDFQALLCEAGEATGCLTQAQIDVVEQFHAPMVLDYPLANGVPGYPGFPVGGEGNDWRQWVMGANGNPGFTVSLGADFIRYFVAQDPDFDTVGFDPNAPEWRERILAVSEMVDATDPDLSAFAASGGKLILQENLGDNGRSALAGLDYHASVVETLGKGRTDKFFRAYAVPKADHGGGAGPNDVDWLEILDRWAADGEAPRDVVLQERGTDRTRPACEWPTWSRYFRGDVDDAASFRCMKAPGFKG
ncbi:tannase/feruloyl esterase family alpha/beta hydrolase [Egicoccus sp. AB-alg2]|uniref:tannase/feruloyl esterase family alpha/beta hydrolase n=1 Tax=Egicoccus sp. AB-alg2 TaxID=3242693 RepID=UPI00359E9280